MNVKANVYRTKFVFFDWEYSKWKVLNVCKYSECAWQFANVNIIMFVSVCVHAIPALCCVLFSETYLQSFANVKKVFYVNCLPIHKKVYSQVDKII